MLWQLISHPTPRPAKPSFDSYTNQYQIATMGERTKQEPTTQQSRINPPNYEKEYCFKSPKVRGICYTMMEHLVQKSVKDIIPCE